MGQWTAKTTCHFAQPGYSPSLAEATNKSLFEESFAETVSSKEMTLVTSSLLKYTPNVASPRSAGVLGRPEPVILPLALKIEIDRI